MHIGNCIACSLDLNSRIFWSNLLKQAVILTIGRNRILYPSSPALLLPKLRERRELACCVISPNVEMTEHFHTRRVTQIQNPLVQNSCRKLWIKSVVAVCGLRFAVCGFLFAVLNTHTLRVTRKSSFWAHLSFRAQSRNRIWCALHQKPSSPALLLPKLRERRELACCVISPNVEMTEHFHTRRVTQIQNSIGSE